MAGKKNEVEKAAPVKTAAETIAEKEKELSELTDKVEKVLVERIAELEAAVVFARDMIDPNGIIAPQPGTPGYMIHVIRRLHKVCPVKK